jgi:glycosyltransferase involved in cell wall biosynthesis
MLSIVIPVYNEEDSIKLLYEEVVKNLEDEEFEIIFVNDGSTDRTRDELLKLAQKDKRVKIISFRKNYGQTAAISAGFEYSSGDIIITMDGDLQNDPADIKKLLKAIEDADVVSGWRWNRKDPLTKKIPSKISNYLASCLTNLKIHDFGCTLKAYRREVIQNIRLYGEMHRYIPGILYAQGFKVSEVKVNHRPRLKGKSKYGISRLIKGFLDLLYIKFWSDYSSRPLHFFGILGIFLMTVSVLIASYKVFYQLLYLGRPLEAGPLLLLSVMLLISGLTLILFGFLSEIQIRTYFESTAKVAYSMKEKINFDK